MQATNFKMKNNIQTADYNEVVDMIKSVPADYLADITNYIGYILYCHNEKNKKIENLKRAIAKGDASKTYDDFDAEKFLVQLKKERKNG